MSDSKKKIREWVVKEKFSDPEEKWLEAMNKREEAKLQKAQQKDMYKRRNALLSLSAYDLLRMQKERNEKQGE